MLGFSELAYGWGKKLIGTSEKELCEGLIGIAGTCNDMEAELECRLNGKGACEPCSLMQEACVCPLIRL